MDKKKLYQLVDELTKTVATANDIEESEARALVGINIRRNKELLTSSPVLQAPKEAKEPAAA